MQRPIKFRAWDNTRGRVLSDSEAEMIYDVLVGSDGYYIDDWGFEPDVVVMQYTGLKDKNGVEIYEGDIVREYYGTKGGYSIGKVAWGEYSDDEYVENVQCWIFGDLQPIQRYDHRHGGYEVIGNIHENPELLKGEN